MEFVAKLRAAIVGICVILICIVTIKVGSAEQPLSITFTPSTFSHSVGPADNPLKGLVPYQGPYPDRFPYSMEFNYLPLSALVKGPDQYDWDAFEEMLNDIASRGNQTVTRVFLEYPGKEGVIPPFLIENGLEVHRYINTNTAPLPPASIETPDYEDPSLREVMTRFIAAWGKRYDGDPRLAYITAGMLGTWGEWHTYPRTELWASKDVQREVLEAFDESFKKTPVLLRYPAGPNDYLYADSTPYHFGYHDDSFAHSTLQTGKPADDWFFWPKMEVAGLSARWETAPIGGEIRPEVWGCCFDEKPCTDATQSFDKCRDVTHVTWLMDTGMNQPQVDPVRQKRAIEAVQKMGYDLEVVTCEVVTCEGKDIDNESWLLNLTIANRGIAPFYHHGWNATLQLMRDDQIEKEIATDWSPRMIQPGQEKTFSQRIDLSDAKAGQYQLQLVMPNPMQGGKPIRFANQNSNPESGALTIATITVRR